ncbi:hypothetical protein [Porphyromonas endodontalis]|uniref:hypothetical protein n=1 Tax=Porphyromonas endodontalis TaxID=28124 RepID=UPI0028E682D7|nr:hypothetical protein [Porphyromonas endodontalis]
MLQQREVERYDFEATRNGTDAVIIEQKKKVQCGKMVLFTMNMHRQKIFTRFKKSSIQMG